MTDPDPTITPPGANDNVHDNMIMPFQLETSHIRGRIVRLGSVLGDIANPHPYPPILRQLLGEATALACVLGGMLKFSGTFTLQAQGDGPVRMVVADLTTDGALRGLAHYNPDALAQAGLNNNAVAPIRATDRIYDLSTLLGDGHLAFTVDQGDFTDRYQGIVALAGPDLVACVGHYFSQSEQIDTILHIAAGETEDGLRAGGLMIQRLPLPATSDPEAVDRAQEDWDRAQALAATLTREELIREPLPANDLLYRLFHEEGVRVYNPVQLRKGCRCHGDRLSAILKTMPADDLAHMTVDGAIVMTCEFCNKDFHFRPDDLSAIPKP